MLTQIRPALVMLALFTVLTGGIYPLVVTGVAQLALASKANGSLIRNDGVVVGSALIGQSFSSDRYFRGRPSATSALDPKDASQTIDSPYNAAASSGSNLGPLSKKLIERVSEGAGSLRAATGSQSMPADAVTTSASGLDPHISPGFAALQVARVAKARGVSDDRIRQIVARHTDRPVLGVLGEPRINVLALNLALDAELASRAG